jgi:Spy/CpxP family protein refolding chaperone
LVVFLIQPINQKEAFMKKIILLALVFVFVLPGISMARDPDFGGGGQRHGKENPLPRGKWWRLPQVVDKLALTQKEKETLDTLYVEKRRTMIDLRSQVQKERLELEQLMDSSNFDAAACMERFQRVLEAKRNLSTERFKFLVGVRELLGLERFQQLKAEFWRHRMKGKRGGRNPAEVNRPAG